MTQSKFKPKPNQIVYTIDGEEAYFAQALDNGQFLVEIVMYDTYEGTELGTKIEIVKNVYETPPVAHYEQKVANLQKAINQNADELTKLKIQIKESYDEIRNQNKLIVDQNAKFNRYKQLKNLELFIDGKITHLVVYDPYSFTFEIKPFDDTLKITDKYDDGKFKLITLFGNSKGDLQWKINQYSDGSGSWNSKVVVPCNSIEEGNEIILREINIALTKEYEVDDHSIIRLVDTAKNYEVAIPDVITEVYIPTMRNWLEGNIKNEIAYVNRERTAMLNHQDRLTQLQQELTQLENVNV